MQGAWVQSLVGELRSHMLHGQKKKKKVMFTLYYSLLSVQRHYVLKKKKPSIYTLILK